MRPESCYLVVIYDNLSETKFEKCSLSVTKPSMTNDKFRRKQHIVL